MIQILQENAFTFEMPICGHTRIALSPDGKFLCVSKINQGKIARLFELNTGTLKANLRNPKTILHSCFSTNGASIVTTTMSQPIISQPVMLWNTHSGECFMEIQVPTKSITAAEFSPQEELLAVIGELPIAKNGVKEYISLWNTQTGVFIRSFEPEAQESIDVQFSPDGTMLLTTFFMGGIKIWNTMTGISNCFIQTSSLYGHTFLLDHQHVFTYELLEHRIKIYNIADGECIFSLGDIDEPVQHAAYSRDLRYFAAIVEKSILIYSLTSQPTQIQKIPFEFKSASQFQFSPRGTWLWAKICSQNGLELIWNTASGSCAYFIQDPDAHADHTIFPDEEHLLKVGYDGKIRIWNLMKKLQG